MLWLWTACNSFLILSLIEQHRYSFQKFLCNWQTMRQTCRLFQGLTNWVIAVMMEAVSASETSENLYPVIFGYLNEIPYLSHSLLGDNAMWT